MYFDKAAHRRLSCRLPAFNRNTAPENQPDVLKTNGVLVRRFYARLRSFSSRRRRPAGYGDGARRLKKKILVRMEIPMRSDRKRTASSTLGHPRERPPYRHGRDLAWSPSSTSMRRNLDQPAPPGGSNSMSLFAPVHHESKRSSTRRGALPRWLEGASTSDRRSQPVLDISQVDVIATASAASQTLREKGGRKETQRCPSSC